MPDASGISQPGDILTQKEALEQTLHKLLERYLTLLDQYQTVQAKLSKDLASGYLSLAQANFANTNRVRYGQDFYDDRMQAFTKISVAPSTPAFSLSNVPAPSLPVIDGETKSLSASDPLKWFGVLVPPALKASQRDFKAAISCTPTMASVANEMKEVEIEVRRTRKRLSKLL